MNKIKQVDVKIDEVHKVIKKYEANGWTLVGSNSVDVKETVQLHFAKE